MGGFLDLYEYLGYEPAKEYVRALTKSADARLDKEVCRDGLQIMSGDMIEWYTLPEQIYRAYQLTGEQLYLDFAKVWDYDYFWDKLLAGDFKIGPRQQSFKCSDGLRDDKERGVSACNRDCL